MATNPNDLDARHDRSFTYGQEELISLLQEYATEYGFTIGLFGSYAKSTAHEDSDIDLVLYEDAYVLREENNKVGYDFKQRLMGELRKTVSINFRKNIKKDIGAVIDTYVIYIKPQGGSCMNILIIADSEVSIEAQMNYAKRVYGEYIDIYFSNLTRDELPRGTYPIGEYPVDNVVVFGEVTTADEWFEIINADSTIIASESDPKVKFDLIRVSGKFYTEEQFLYAIESELSEADAFGNPKLYKMTDKANYNTDGYLHIDNVTGIVNGTENESDFDNVSVYKELRTHTGTVASLIARAVTFSEDEHVDWLYSEYGVIIPSGFAIKTLALLPTSVLDSIGARALKHIEVLINEDIAASSSFTFESTHRDNYIQNLEALSRIAEDHGHTSLCDTIDSINDWIAMAYESNPLRHLSLSFHVKVEGMLRSTPHINIEG